MAEIRVTTEVEIRDELGHPVLRIMHFAKVDGYGNPAFFVRHTRSAIQETECAIAEMLCAKCGDNDA